MTRDPLCPIIHEISEPALNSRFFMLREDLLGTAFGGNKLLIASEYIRDMADSGRDAMLLYGDRRSNLCRVLALLCEREHISARMIAARSSEGESGSSLNERLILSAGVEIVPCGEDIAQTVDSEMQRFRDEGRNPYYIFGTRFGNGNEGTAARAYAKRWKEILAWEKECGVHFDLIALPCGNGCTYGGLLAGMLASGQMRETVGISISSRTRERAGQVLFDTVRDYFRKELLPAPSEEEIHACMNLTCDFNGGGYGLVNDEIRQAVRKMLKTNSIGLPLIYGGKAYAGLLKWMEREYTQRGRTLPETVLFIHTGGIPLFFDDLAEGAI